MKKLILIIVVIIMISQVHNTVTAQNLVANPSFEDTVQCPNNSSQTYYSVGWNTNINSADYFNSCCNNPLQVAVPKNAWGYQCPANGNAYAGFYASNPYNPNANEFLGTLLVTPLTISQKYYVSFKVNLADGLGLNCGVDKLGALFTNVNYGSTTLSPNTLIANNAHIYSSQIITDTMIWVIVRGSFVADSAYKYILLGHFFDLSNTNFTCFNSNPKWSYYFIDDICVSTDSLTCEIPNGSNVCDSTANISETEFNKENITVYPNPTKNNVFIKLSQLQRTTIKIFNLFGELLFENNFSEKNITINLSSYPDGMYIIQAQQDKQVFNKKFTLIK